MLEKLVGVLVVMGIILCAALPFHYLIGYGNLGIAVFSKKGLTLENTIITKETVDGIVRKYNNADFMERMQMNSDPIMLKLQEKGIIVDKKEDDGYGD